MFRAFSRPSSGAQWLWFYLGPARPRTQHDCHHDTRVKPETVTAVAELLMMDGKTPETCWAANRRQDNKLENCWIWLVIYLNCTMMYGLTNLKFKHRVFWKSIYNGVHFLDFCPFALWRRVVPLLFIATFRKKHCDFIFFFFDAWR
jgi:hypothetical protein